MWRRVGGGTSPGWDGGCSVGWALALQSLGDPERSEQAGRWRLSACAGQSGSREAGRAAGRAGHLTPPPALQVPSWAMDMNVLKSAQLLMEQVAAEGSGPLLYPLYHHLLFNFHLWALGDFAVCLGR